MIKIIQKTINNKETLHHITLAIFVCILLFSVSYGGKKLYSYYHDNLQYEKIREQLPQKNTADRFSPVPGSTNAPSEYNNGGSAGNNNKNINGRQDSLIQYKMETGDIRDLDQNGNLAEYSNLKNINKDIAGWIFMPGFKKALDYPVMKAVNNEYYLYKDFYRNYSYAGSIFMDYRNNPSQVDKHIVIYGHAMNDFSMFGNLKEFSKKPEYYKQFTKIYFDFMTTRLEYQVFSTYIEDASYDNRKMVFRNDIEFKNYFNLIRLKSAFDYGVNINPTDKILTLSTCNNTKIPDGRSIIHAKLIKQIVYAKASGNNISELPGNNISDNKVPGNNKSGNNAARHPVSANVYLTRLSLKYRNKNKEIEIVLTPLFDTVLKEFSAIIPSAAGTVLLDVQTSDPRAKTEITVNGTVTNLRSIQMATGENIINIRIISQDGQYSRTYTIKVLKNSDN
jgi:sortase B